MEPGPNCTEDGGKKHPRQSAAASIARVLAVFTFWMTLIISCDIFYVKQALIRTEGPLPPFNTPFFFFKILNIAIRPLYNLTCIHFK
jgi:hypothetical protein